jgi:cytoskeleton protein RodZ
MTEELEIPAVQGPGELLKKARERAKLSVQYIADKLLLKKKVIEDLEQDNYDINISHTFIKGYLKLYAKQVKIEEVIIMSAFEQLNNQNKEPAKLQSFSRRVANQANDDKLMLVTYLVLAVVLALVVIWWFQQSGGGEKSVSSVPDYKDTQPIITQKNPIVVETKVTEILGELDRNEAVEATTPNDFNASQTLQDISDDSPVLIQPDVEPVVSEDPVVVDDTSQNIVDTISPQGSQPIELVFEFAGDCWINIADSTGENIAFGVKVKGRVMPITGIPPFIVTLGAPEMVSISYAGEDVDMSFLVPGRIANFALPLTE